MRYCVSEKYYQYGQWMMSWGQRLRQAGYRVTAARRAVIDVLQCERSPLTPQEIGDRARDLHEGLGLATVYRTLALLSELSLVRRVHRQDGCHGYLAASPGHCHAVLCRLCGRAVEFEGCDDIVPLIYRVEEQTGYRVEGHLLQLTGLCPGCRTQYSTDENQ